MRVIHSGDTIRGGVLIGLMLAAGMPSSFCHAAPPRVIDENEPALQPAAFAQPDNLEPAQLISPRSQSENPARKSGTKKKNSTPSASIWGTVIGLAAVFGLFLAGRVWLSRHGPVGFRGLPAEALELLGKRAIEPRVSIHIVRCGPKILVLGVSPDGIRTLTEITDPVEIDLMAGACRRKDAGLASANFAGMFRRSGADAQRNSLGDA